MKQKNVFACCYPTFPYCAVRDISAVYCEDHTKHTQCTGKVQCNASFLMLKQLVHTIGTMVVRLNT